jgi:hypothetical protein
VKLWDDANADGIPEGASFVAIGSFSGDNGTVTMVPGTEQLVTRGTSRHFVVTVDLANAVASAPAPAGERRLPWGLGFLAILGITALGFRRRPLAALLLLVLAFGLFMTACNGGGTPPAPANVTYSYSANIGPGDVQASDSATQNPSAVLFTPAAGFSSAPVNVTVQVGP